jgi:uncharacterized protein YbaA (DUF1428 family)
MPYVDGYVLAIPKLVAAKPIFDEKRMFWGGFKVLVDV